MVLYLQMMRVVIDTNIVIAGLYSRRGASFRVLEAALKNNIDYVVSPFVALEYIGKVEEKMKAGLLGQPREFYLAFIRALIEKGVQVQQPALERPTLKDPTDDKILECALAGECSVILTFNTRDFPAKILKDYHIRAMDPGEFLRERRNR